MLNPEIFEVHRKNNYIRKIRVTNTVKVFRKTLIVSLFLHGFFSMTFGQTDLWNGFGALPDSIPVVFARGIISTQCHEHSAPAFSTDGNEVYWSRWERAGNDKPQVVMRMVKTNEKWENPEIAPFSGEVVDGGPVISADGKKLFIYREEPGQEYKIICFTKSGNGWINPQPIIPGFSFSVSKNGNLYYGYKEKIYKLEFKNNKYGNPTPLNEKINLAGYLNWTPFVAPDESYLIFSRCDNNGDYGNLMICFWSDTKNDWLAPVDMGAPINSWRQERFPYVSSDGKYLFFNRDNGGNDDIFWVSSRIIEKLKTKR